MDSLLAKGLKLDIDAGSVPAALRGDETRGAHQLALRSWSGPWLLHASGPALHVLPPGS